MASVPLANPLAKPSALRLLLLNLALALGYYLLAIFGLQWSSYTSQVSLVWPGAGLSLFALLIFDIQLLPGLCLGVFCANYFLHFATPNSPVQGLWAIAPAALIAAGSVLQALVIARLNRRLLAAARPPSSRRSLWFAASIFGGTLLGATSGVTVLHYWQLIGPGDLLENWLTWWLGDAIGMLVVTPLLAWWLVPSLRQDHARTQVFLLLSTGLGVLLLLVSLIGYQERSNAKARFRTDSQLLQLALQRQLLVSQQQLQLLAQALASNSLAMDGDANFNLFARLGSELQQNAPWLQQLAWLPGANSHNWQNLPSTAAQPWPTDDEQPLIQQALASGTALVSPMLNSGPKSQPDITWLLPVCPTRQCPHPGLLAMKLDMGRWLSAGLEQTLMPALDISLSANPDQHHEIRWQQDHWVAADASPEHRQQLVHASPLFLANQTLLLHTRLDLRHWFLPSWLQATTLGIGLLIIGLLAAYLRARQKHQDSLVQNQQRLEREVKEQTLALRTANDWLLKEIEQRQQTQEQLQSSQLALQQRQQELRSLLNNIPDPIWLKDTQGRYIACNKAFTKLLGRAEDEIIGKEEQQLVSRDIAQIFRRNDKVALGSDQPHRYEQWLTGADGQLYMLDTLKVAVRDENQQTFGILGIGRDITDKHQLIDELEKFKRFAENSSQGFAITNLQAETLYMNPAMRVMLNGYLQDGNFKKAFWEYYPEALQAQVRDEIIPRVIDAGQWQGEMAALHADGSQFPTQETFFVIRDDQDRCLYLGIVMSDISAQKETEAALSQAKEAAEDAAKAKSRFLANMSHEIRTPLNAVLGYTQLLMRDQQIGGPQRERLELILNASQRLLGLINDILDLSKIESGALNLRQDYFDLHQEVAEIANIISGRAQSKGLKLTIQVDLPKPSVVKGDRQKIGQILLNLLGNAVKFTQQGEVRLHLKREAEQVEFEISDTGPGIAPQELQQLFSAFRQGQAGEDAGGTGLGLTLSRHLAQGMGGNLELTSQLGRGTQARLHLPLPTETIQLPTNHSPRSLPQLAAGASCKLLVVEDDKDSCDVLVSLLAQLGCEVSSAANGRQGLEACAQAEFNMIFTDIRMPDLNGLEMLHRLRQLPRYADKPLVAVSASSLDHERSYYLAQGFQDFIGKPYSFEEIFRALEKFSGARFEAGDGEVQAAPTPDENNPGNLAPLFPLLRQLAQAAVSGDMSQCRRLVADFTPQQLGSTRLQQLQTALKQYNLEQVEQLATLWLS